MVGQKKDAWFLKWGWRESPYRKRLFSDIYFEGVVGMRKVGRRGLQLIAWKRHSVTICLPIHLPSVCHLSNHYTWQSMVQVLIGRSFVYLLNICSPTASRRQSRSGISESLCWHGDECALVFLPLVSNSYCF